MQMKKSPLPFIISSAGRSGNHLLRGLLNSTKLVGNVKELVNSRNELSNDSQIVSHFKQYYEHLFPDQRYWGLVVRAPLLRVFERWLDIVEVNPKEIKWIWLVRRDKFAQAISSIRATQTRVWCLSKKHPEHVHELNNVEVDVKEIAALRSATNYFFHDQLWDTFFERQKITPFKLYYEDFGDPSVWDSVVADILDFLEVPYQVPLNVSTIFLKQGKIERHEKVYRQLVNSVNKRVPRKYMPFDYEVLGMDTDNSLKGQ